MSNILALAKGIFRITWRSLAVTAIVWHVKWTRAVWGGNEAAFIVSHARKYAITPALRALGASIADTADIEPHLLVHNAHAGCSGLTVGDRCHIGKACLLDLASPITLEPGCTLSMQVSLITHIDVGQTPLRNGPYPVTSHPITVCTGAYIGARATLLQGVRVGRCAVVAAGAVVREDVPDFTVVGGIPARVLKTLELTEKNENAEENTNEPDRPTL